LKVNSHAESPGVMRFDHPQVTTEGRNRALKLQDRLSLGSATRHSNVLRPLRPTGAMTEFIALRCH
jgi:hypothetical protein